MYVYMYVLVNKYENMCMNLCICMYVCMYVCMHTSKAKYLPRTFNSTLSGLNKSLANCKVTETISPSCTGPYTDSP